MKSLGIAAWYDRQSARDQLVLRIGGLVAGLIVLLMVLLSLQRNVQSARERVQARQADLEWMRQVGPTLAAAGPGAAQQPSRESLLVLVDRSARESGLANSVTGSQPMGNGVMRVQMENADFNQLIGWLWRLSSQHGVGIEAGSVTGAGGRGVVNASLQLSPATATP